MNRSSSIKHVSDTALWVATYRAQESDRKLPLFRDPLARVLAGERGQRIADGMPYREVLAWHMVMRTVSVDRLLLRAISEGADVVLNLGAGLDTRPYRMALPETLQWIEIDFPHMIEFKNHRLKGEKVACQLQRVSTDLSNVDARRELFDSIGRLGKKVAVISEGLIPYMSQEEAESLSKDLLAVPHFHFWMMDCRQGGIRIWAPRKLRKILKASPFKFDVPDMLGFFCGQGWKVLENRFTLDEAESAKRPLPFIFPWSMLLRFLPKRLKEKLRTSSSCVLYSRT